MSSVAILLTDAYPQEPLFPPRASSGVQSGQPCFGEDCCSAWLARAFYSKDSSRAL